MRSHDNFAQCGEFCCFYVDLINCLFCKTDCDPMFWEEIRCANSEGAATRFLETYTEGNAAPSPNNGCRWPVSNRKAFDRERDAELSRPLSRTEVLFAGFVEQCRLSQSEGQSLLNMMLHPRLSSHRTSARLLSTLPLPGPAPPS